VTTFRQQRSYLRPLALALLATAATACSAVPPQPLTIETGSWTLHSAARTTEIIEVRSLRPGEYYLSAAGHPLAGVYVLRGAQLEIVKPDNPRMGGTIWLVNGTRSMTLVEEPPVQMSGRKFVAAQMSRND
jgi:hypothetical protein